MCATAMASTMLAVGTFVSQSSEELFRDFKGL
jgi:hypothetical protein